MATKFYVIWQGRETGIFTDWATCKKHVEKFAGAKYKSFKTREEAEAAFHGNVASSSSKQRAKPKASSAKTVKTYTAIEIAAMPIDTKVFTDGACSPNPGKAGTGIAIYRNDRIDELWYGIYNANGTNNTAELNGLNQALIIAKDELEKSKTVAIFCDSKYSIQCITQWAVGWQKKGWKKNSGEIKNLDLIKEIFSLYQLLKDKVQILHVNGHVGVEGNELADRMSMVAIDAKEHNFSLYRDALDIPAILAMRAG